MLCQSWLQEKGINISTNNKEATAEADVIILAIKPFQIKEILEEIASRLSENQLLISVVTGISLDEIKSIVGDDVAVVRAMPNTAIAIQESITCLSSSKINTGQLAYTEALFEALGKTVVIDEKLMNAATV